MARLAAGAQHQAARRHAAPGGSTTCTSPTSSAKASGRCSSTAGAAWAITATRSASPATPFRYGIRWPSSPGSRLPRPTWATPTGATTSAATCRAPWSRSSSRAGCSSAPSAPSCAPTPPRILTPSAASGPIPNRTRRSCARPSSFATRLQPYIYTEARRTYDTGVAFFRPLYYDWPEEDAAYTSKDEYIFGDQMLAAPVAAPADKVTRPGHGEGLAAQGRMDRMAHGQALHRPGQRRSQLLHRPDARLSARRRHRAHAAAHALHRRKACRPADRECVAARAGRDLRATRSMRTRASRSSISAASLRARRSRPRKPATRCAWRSARSRAAIPAC